MSHLIDCVVGFTFLVDSRALTFVPLTRYWQSIRAKMMWSREQQLVRQAVALVLDNFYRSPASENEDKYKDVGGSEVSEDKGDGEGNANNAGDNMEEEEEGGRRRGKNKNKRKRKRKRKRRLTRGCTMAGLVLSDPQSKIKTPSTMPSKEQCGLPKEFCGSRLTTILMATWMWCVRAFVVSAHVVLPARSVLRTSHSTKLSNLTSRVFVPFLPVPVPNLDKTMD